MSSPKTTPHIVGKVDKSTWRRTAVHAATVLYGCGRCGLRFSDPAAFYGHAERGHGGQGERRGRPATARPEGRVA